MEFMEHSEHNMEVAGGQDRIDHARLSLLVLHRSGFSIVLDTHSCVEQDHLEVSLFEARLHFLARTRLL